MSCLLQFRRVPRARFAGVAQRPDMLLLVASLCFGLAGSSSSATAAGWLGKKAIRKPEPAVAAPKAGLPDNIRRLMTAAQAAADRGDLVTAQRFADRAYKMAATCRASLANVPDCSPELLAEQSRRFADLQASQGGAASRSEQKASGVIDPTPFIDVPMSEAAPLVPPSPSPVAQIVTAPRKDLSGIMPSPSIHRTPRVSAHSPRPKSAQPETHPVAKIEASPTTQIPADEPWTTPGTSRAPSPPQSFLAMRSEWLDADSPEKLGDSALGKVTEDRRAQSRSAVPAETVDDLELSDDAEVTTAIGSAEDAHWELDLNTTESDSTSWDSRPLMQDDPAPQTVSASPSPSERVTESNDGTSQPLGVWSGSAPSAGVSSRVRNVVSLSEFLDPSMEVAAATSRPAIDDAPRLIETDFRSPTVSRTTEMTLESRTAENQTSPQESPSVKEPLVSYREDPALDWLPAADVEAQPRMAGSNWLHHVWPARLDTATLPVVIGAALLISGLLICGLSFRRN